MATSLLLTCWLSGCASGPVIPVDLGIPVTALTVDEWASEKMNAASIKLTIPPRTHASEKALSKVVSLNVLGFLYQSDYSKQDSPEAITASRRFIKKHKAILALAEQTYGVSKEAITSLLWVETKFGKHMGRYPLVHVYFQLLKADHPDVIRQTLDELMIKRPDADLALKKKCVDRSKSKAAWALEQLKAVATILENKGLSISRAKASYAGAFGIPQFIPSSYIKYAVAHKKSNPANLFYAPDAILSVGSFLKLSGWIEKSEPDQMKALFEYNRSKDYGAIILKIAEKLQKI